jgi:hypothetical protein
MTSESINQINKDYLGPKLNIYKMIELDLKNIIECKSDMKGQFISNWCIKNCKHKWYIIPAPMQNYVLFENKIEASLFKLLTD